VIRDCACNNYQDGAGGCKVRVGKNVKSYILTEGEEKSKFLFEKQGRGEGGGI